MSSGAAVDDVHNPTLSLFATGKVRDVATSRRWWTALAAHCTDGRAAQSHRWLCLSVCVCVLFAATGWRCPPRCTSAHARTHSLTRT